MHGSQEERESGSGEEERAVPTEQTLSLSFRVSVSDRDMNGFSEVKITYSNYELKFDKCDSPLSGRATRHN